MRNRLVIWFSVLFLLSASIGATQFDTAITVTTSNQPHSVVIQDFDGDGTADIALGYYGGSAVKVFRGNGTGAFPTMLASVPISEVDAIDVCDIESDGDYDILALGRNSSLLNVLRNDGTGQLTLETTYSVGNIPYSMSHGDIDSDGDVDVVVANSGAAPVCILRNSGTGVFALDSVVSSHGAISVILEDVDQDDDLDLLSASFSSGKMTAYLNDGSGVFVLSQQISVGTNPWSITGADFDGDGDVDVAVALTIAGTVVVMQNNGTGMFSPDTVLSAPGAWYILSGDWDKDDNFDLVVSNFSGTNAYFFRNSGNASFISPDWLVGLNQPISIATFDIDGDSSQDLAFANYTSPGSYSVLLNANPDFRVVSVGADGIVNNQRVLSILPTFSWTSSLGVSQLEYVLEIGSDSDWSVAEMWNPAPLHSSDTFVTYAGAPLVDGQTYYLRLRISDGVSWSNWYYTSFHMNTPPTAPVPYAPQWPNITVSTTPDLSVVNATDAENDTLAYDFEVYYDSMLTQLAVASPHVAETHDPDSTSWTVAPPLTDNKYYYWRARAFDGYEYSPWSSMRFFIADNVNEPPNPFTLIDPPDSTGSILYNRKPTFRWTYTGDPDPYNQVRYKLELAVDPTFTFKQVIDSLYTSFWIPPDSLPYHSHHWWRVTAIDQHGATTLSPNVKEFWVWTLGDVDHSNNVDIADLSRLIDYLYISFGPIDPRKVGDLDGDCTVDIADLSRMIDYLYLSLVPLTVGGCGP